MQGSISASLNRLILWKNVIYNELRMRGYNVDVGIIPHFAEFLLLWKHKRSCPEDFSTGAGPYHY